MSLVSCQSAATDESQASEQEITSLRADRPADRQADRHAGTQTGIQTGTQTDRHTDRQAGTQTKTILQYTQHWLCLVGLKSKPTIHCLLLS